MVRKTTKIEEIPVSGEETSKSLATVISEGAADACSAAANFVPAAGKVVRRTIYTGFYYLTYGVVFSSLAIASVIPMNNAMGAGIHDGAEAARKAFQEHEAAAEGEAAPTPA